MRVHRSSRLQVLYVLVVSGMLLPTAPFAAEGEVLAPPFTRQHFHTSKLPHSQSPSAPHALLFVTDGGRPDLFREFAERGLLPGYARLEAEGAMGANGMLPQLPTSTRVGWQTISTGAWAGTHGALNNVYTLHGLGMAE